MLVSATLTSLLSLILACKVTHTHLLPPPPCFTRIQTHTHIYSLTHTHTYTHINTHTLTHTERDLLTHTNSLPPLAGSQSSLQCIELEACPSIDHTILRHIAHCSALRRLELAQCALAPDEPPLAFLTALRSLRQLRSLSLRSCRFLDDAQVRSRPTLSLSLCSHTHTFPPSLTYSLTPLSPSSLRSSRKPSHSWEPVHASSNIWT